MKPLIARGHLSASPFLSTTQGDTRGGRALKRNDRTGSKHRQSVSTLSALTCLCHTELRRTFTYLLRRLSAIVSLYLSPSHFFPSYVYQARFRPPLALALARIRRRSTAWRKQYRPYGVLTSLLHRVSIVRFDRYQAREKMSFLGTALEPEKLQCRYASTSPRIYRKICLPVPLCTTLLMLVGPLRLSRLSLSLSGSLMPLLPPHAVESIDVGGCRSLRRER